jgi:hypothetical protein
LTTDESPATAGAPTPGEVTEALWREILGPAAGPERSFLDNGGDSFHAVLLSTRLYEATGVEADYLDVLTSKCLAGLRTLAGSGGSAAPAVPIGPDAGGTGTPPAL